MRDTKQKNSTKFIQHTKIINTHYTLIKYVRTPGETANDLLHNTDNDNTTQ